MTLVIQYIDNLGKNTFDLYRNLVRFVIFIYLGLRCTVLLPLQAQKTVLSNTISQIYFTGCKALPLITFIALATGGIVILQFTQFSILSSQETMGNILVVTIVRELGPLLTSLIIIARSGTAVASEVGTMQVNREIEALRAMSIEPLSFVVFPRIVGGVIGLVCLAFYFNCIALIGGYFVAQLISDFSFSFYIEVIAQALTPQDFTLNLLKNSISGLIIFAIATDQGYKVKSSAHEVPIAGTNAVVKSVMAVMAFNLVISILAFIEGL